MKTGNIYAVFLAVLVAAAGCSQQPDKNVSFSQGDCPVKTPGFAVSPQGKCSEFKKFCEIPSDFNVVKDCTNTGIAQDKNAQDSAGQGEELCSNVKCEDTCDGNTFKSGGKCLGGKCYYLSTKLNAVACGAMPIEKKYDFNANMEKCLYDRPIKQYTIVYKIRNMTDNVPPKMSKMWMFAPSLNYASGKTVQRDYLKNKIMWEEQSVNLSGANINGQYWQFKAPKGDYNFMILFCEPEFASQKLCNTNSGLPVAQGNTGEICSEFEEINITEIDELKKKIAKQI